MQHTTQLAEARPVESTHVPEIIEKCKEETRPTKENEGDHTKLNSDIKKLKGGVKKLGQPETIVDEDANSTVDVSCKSELNVEAPVVE